MVCGIQTDARICQGTPICSGGEKGLFVPEVMVPESGPASSDPRVDRFAVAGRTFRFQYLQSLQLLVDHIDNIFSAIILVSPDFQEYFRNERNSRFFIYTHCEVKILADAET
jgi:hypothetical protein